MSKKTTNIIKGNKNRVKPSEYLKNVTKSVAYISLDTVSGMNPAIKNLADSNSDVSKMIYETVKDYKAVLRNVKTKIVESDYYKIGKSGFENAIDDLKTGKFYNKEREDAIDTKLTMGGDGDDFFDDFNMDDFDFNFDDDGEDDEVIDKGDKLIAKEIDSSSRALAGSIGSTTIESAKYLADTQKASTRMLYDQNNRLLGSLNLGMGTVSASVQQIVAYQEKLNAHIENSTTFFGEMTSQMKTTNELLVKIVENQEKALSNGELEDNSKERMTYSDIDDGMGGVSLKNYFKYIVKNAKGMSGGVFDLLSNTFSGGNILESFAASPWKMVTEAVINKAIPEMIKEATEELNKSVTGLFAGLQGLLGTLPGGEDSKLYQLLHIDNSIKSRIDTSKYHKEAQAWNGIDHKALTEVIPDQLSEIISLLSGKDKRLFDYDKGQYVNVTDIKKQFEKDYNQVGIKAGSDLMQEMKAMFKEISFDSKDFEEGLTKAMEDMFAKAAKNGTFFNVWDPNFDLTSELGVDPRYKRHLQAALKATNRSTQMEYNLKQREAIANWNNNMKKQELENSIYRYIFDNSELTHIKTDKQGRVIHDKDQSLIGTMSLDRQKDNLGHNVFYYLQNINKELTYIRQSNKYTAGAGGRGRYGRSIEIVRTDIDGNEKVVRADVNSKKLSYDDIKLEDKTADEYKRELDREAREVERYTAKQDERREKNPNIVKSEDLDDLDDKHFDRSYQNIAEEVRERDRLAGKKAKLPHTFSTLDELVKAETFSEKVKVINDNFKALLHKPADILASAMQAADKAIYTLVYGDKRDKDGKRKGFMREMMDQMKLSFLKFHDWMDGIFGPLKEKLGVDQFREVPGKIFEHFFGMTPHEAYVDFKSYLFGEFEEDADGNKYRIADGLLTGFTDGIKEAFNDTGEFLKETFKPIKDFIDGKKKDKTEEEKNDEDEDTDEEYNSVGLKEIEAEKVDPKEAAKQLMNEKKTRRKRELDEKREKLQEELGDKLEIDDSNASLFINDLINDDIGIDKAYNLLYGRKFNRTITNSDFKTKKAALEAIMSQRNDTADFLDSFISKNRDNKKYANNLYSFLLANNYDINDLTMEDLMGILSDKNNISALNGDLRRYIKSASKENSDVLSMNLKQFRDFVIQDYGANHLTGSFGKVKTPQDDLMESLNSPQDVAKGLLSDDAINDIADVFMDPLEESIGISENIENILEDILDAVRSIHPANQPEKRPRFMGSKRYHDSYDMLDAVHAGEEEIEPEAFDDINGMAYGGRVVKSGPVILSEGEYVFNPADAKTKKRQAANEARIAKKLGLQMQPRMVEGGEVEFDDSSIVTADHLVDNRKINGRNRDIYRFGNYEYYEYKRGKWKRVDDDNTIYIRPKDTNSMSEWNPKKFKNRKAKMIQDVEDGKYEEGEEPLAYKMYETTANAANQVFRSIGISKDDEDALGKATADVMHNIKEYAPYMIGTGLIGGGVSLITGLVGGPLLGAASGAAIGLIKKSDKVQDWLFGEIGEDGSRQGGVISKDLQNKVSKYLPDMAKGGVLGGTAGLLTQLFTPLGPVGGIMVGSAIGFAKNNEEIKKTLFGDNWEENSKKFKDKLKSLVPGLAVGALAGIGGLGGSLGLFPAAIIGTLGGWAASTEKMKRLLFGKLQEDGTRDNTGLFGAIKVGIVDPIKENSKKLFDDIRKWVKDDIISPVKRSIDPIFKFVTNIGGTVLGFLGDKIGESLDHGVTAVFAKYLKDNVIGKTAKRIGWVGNQLLSPAKFVISSPFRAIGAVGDHLRGRQVAKGQADYMTASERVQYRADRKNKKGLFGIGRKLRGDKFSKFDKFISTASDDQLYDLNGQLKEMIDPDNFYKKKSADAETELRNTIYALNNGIEFKDAAKIEKAIKKGDYDKARTLIGKAPDLDPYTRDRLMHNIFEAGAEYNSVQKQREQLKTQGRLSLGVIRNMSGGIFKGLKSYKDLDKYKTYLNKEIDVRSQKSDVEEQTEVLEKQHKEVVDLFKFANDRLRALTDPEFAIELTNRERHEAMTAANKRYGSFSIRKRDKSTLMYDYRTNPETGDEEMTYIGPGSKWHKLEHADDYDENGEYKYHSLKGSHALANAKHGHWAGNNIKDIAFMYQQQGMSEDEALELARENYIGDDKKIFKGFIKRRLLTKQAHNEIQIINYAKDLAVANGKSEDDYEEFLDDARSRITRKFFGGVSRSGRKKAASLNYQVTRNAIRDKYAESMSDDDANSLADRQMEEANKKPWYRFVGVKRFKMKVDQDGAPAIDTSDPSSIRNLQDVYKAEEVQSKTYTVISAIDNSITGFIHRLLGTGDEEEGKTPVWKKLLKGGLKVLGAWTVISMGPYLKKLWQDTIAPQISSSVGKVLAPVAPALENIALKLDNFFLNIFPNTIKNVARGAIGWLTGSGEYKNSGLPYVFKQHIIPFYMGGLEFLMEDIIPNTVGLFFKHLPTMLMNTASNLSKMWTWSLQDIIKGNYVKDNKASLSSKDIVNDIKNYEYKPKTGPFYGAYKSLFGSSSRNDLSGTSVETVNKSSTKNESGTETGQPSFKDKVKNFFGLNKTSEMYSNRGTSTSSTSTVKTKSVKQVAGGYDTTPSSNINYEESYGTSPYVESYGGTMTSSGMYIPVYNDEPITTVEDNMNSYYAMQDESNYVVDEETGTAYMVDDNGNRYELDTEGAVWVQDANGEYIQVSTNQDFNWSAYDGLYHGYDEEGNEVALTTGQYFGRSMSNIAAGLYGSLQDNAAKGKGVLENIVIGAQRGHLGHAIIRSFVNGKAGILGGLSQVGAKRGIIGRTLTKPIRGIGKVVNAAGTAGDASRTALAQVTKWKREKAAQELAKKAREAAQELAKKAREAERKKILNFAKTKKTVSSKIINNKTNKIIAEESTKAGNKAAREFLESKGLPLGQGLLDDSYTALSKADKKAIKKAYKSAVQEAEKSATAKAAAKNLISNSTDDTVEHLAQVSYKSADNLIKEAGESLAESTSEKAVKATIADKFKDICCNKKVIGIISKVGGNFSESVWVQTIDKAGKKLAEEFGAKLLGKGVSKVASFLGKLSPIGIGFDILDFIRGMNEAQKNLAILRKPTFVEKILSGLITVINSHVTLGLMPETLIYDFLININPFGWFDHLQAERQEGQEFIELYNEANDTNYKSLGEYYNEKQKPWWKFKDKEEEYKEQQAKNRVDALVQYRQVREASTRYTTKSNLDYLSDVTVPSKPLPTTPQISKINYNLESKLNKNLEGGASGIKDTDDELYKQAITDQSGDFRGNIIDSAKDKATDKILSTAKSAVQHSALFEKLKKMISSRLQTILCSEKLCSIFSKIGKFNKNTWREYVYDITMKLSEKIFKNFAKAPLKLSKFLSKFSPLAIISTFSDFMSGWNNAQINLRIMSEPSLSEKALSGIITVINSYITFGLVPESYLYDIFIHLNPFGWFDKLQIERSKANDYVKAYNQANNTSYINYSELLEARQVSGITRVKQLFGLAKKQDFSEQDRKAKELYDSTYSGTGSGLAQYTATPNQVANSLQRGTFISQYDNQFANTPFNISGDTKKQTVADAGCGPASAAMVVNDALHGIDKTSKEDLDKNSLMNDSINYALSNKYKVTDGGVVPQYFTDYFRSKGLNATKYSNSGDVASQIESGSRMVVLGQDSSNKSKENSPFGPNGHYVVVNGMSKDGQYVFVNDPELSVSNVPYSTNLFMKGVQLGIKAINKKSGYNVGKDFSSGKGTLYNDPNTAALYQDLCSWSSVSEATLTNTIKQFVKDNKRVKRPSNNILVRKAKIFLIAAKESELDPRFLVALACIISDYGLNEYVRTYNNPFGLKYKGEYLSFASIEDGIIEGAKFIKHFYYMRGERYSLIQMATNTYPDCKGDTYNPDNAKGWHIKVAKFMASRKMPNNSKAVLFTEGPKGMKDVIPEVTGKAVYDEGVNATSIITKISSIFSNMFNAVFGFSTDSDDEEGYVDADGEEAYLHANGHPFTCYCEQCHPEMYDNGRPIHIYSVLYQYAANRYYENAENNNTSANGKTGKDKYTKSQNETRDILSKVYELAGFSASDVSSYGITTQTFTDMNKYALSDAKEDMRIRSLYSKFFLLGGLYKKGLLDKDIQTPSNEVRPKLSKYASSKWKYNPGEDKSYADMASFAEILENDLDVFDVESKYEVTKKGVGLNINDAESLYNSMLMLYSKYSGSDYDVSGFGKSVNSSSYGTDVIGYVNRAKSIYNNIKANRPDIFGKIVSNLGYIPEGVKFSDSAYATKSDIERYKQEGTMISDKNVVSRKLLFEKTNTFNPMNVKDITITPYRKSSSFAPEFYLANATVTGKNSKAFITKFLGIPVYGIGSINGADPAWNIADYGDPYSDSYKNSYGVNAWNVGPQVTEFRKQLGIGTEAKEPGKTRNDPYVEYRKKAIEKASKEGRPDKIDYYYHELLKKDGIDLDVSLKESTNRALPTFELKYLSPTGQLMTKTLTPDAKDKFYSDYYNAAILLNKSNEESLGDDMELVTPSKVAVSMKDSALASIEAADKAVGNFFETQDSDYGNLVEDEAADGQGSGLGSFVSQLDPRYANMRFNTSKDTVKQTLGEAGCAPAVATMAINNYTGGASMADMSKAALKYKVKNGGTSSDYFSDVFAKNGISSSYTTSQSDIKNSLKNGNSVVLLGQDSSNKSKANSPFGPGSHYVLANGISPDGKEIYVNDPELNGPATYSSKILRNTNLGVTVGGSSGLSRRTFIGMGSYKKETRSKKDIQRQNLAKFSPVTAEQMNAWIASKNSSSPFNGHGEYFIEASEKSGLDPRYLLAHAAVESGWGTSRISQKYHNYFGIGAFDSNPDNSRNYNNNGMRAGIVNGAIWIAKNYYSSKYKQTSVYRMRYNNGIHQYCTSKTWVDTISSIMASGPKNTKFSYDLSPSDIKQGKYISGEDSVDSSSTTSLDSSGQKDSSVIGAFQSRVSNMFNVAFGIDSGSYTNSSGGVFKSIDKSWVSIVKAVKKAMAKTIGYYQMGGTPQKITVNGKTIKARPDCSGFVSACLIIADVLSPGTFYSSSNFVDGSGGLEKKLNKAGFTKHSWNGWQALAKGDIIAKNGHVEIYSHTDKSGTHKVYNYGSKHSAPVPGVSTSAKKEYTVYWTKSGSGSLLVGLGSSLLSNINSSIRNGVRSRGSVNRFAGLGTVDKMIRLLSGKGYTKNEPKYTPDGKRSYVASGSNTEYRPISNTYDENYDMLDSSGAFMEYTYDGKGSKRQDHYHNIPVSKPKEIKSLKSNINSSIRNGVRSRGSVSTEVGLGTVDKMIRLLSGKGYTKNEPNYTPDGKRSYVASGSTTNTTNNYTTNNYNSSNAYDENYDMLDSSGAFMEYTYDGNGSKQQKHYHNIPVNRSGGSSRRSYIKNFNSYSSTSGYGTTNNYNSNYYNRELINSVGRASAIDPAIQALIATCAKYLASIAANSKQMKTIVTLLTKIATKSKSGSGSKVESGKGNKSNNSSSASSVIINNSSDDEFNDPGLEAMIRQLSELAE